jgi:hypothetical protein
MAESAANGLFTEMFWQIIRLRYSPLNYPALSGQLEKQDFNDVFDHKIDGYNFIYILSKNENRMLKCEEYMNSKVAQRLFL